MGYGHTNALGATYPELLAVRAIAESAAEAADTALRKVTQLTSVINTVPSQSGTVTYTGSAQSPSWNNYDSSALKIGGVTSATDAGTYTATFTPVGEYVWPDGTQEPKAVPWVIGKAEGQLSLDKESLPLNVSQLTGIITVTRPGDGAITAESSDTDVATVSVSGTVVTVTAQGKGSATITVNVGEGSNYTAPAAKTVAVTVDLVSHVLAESTPAQIQKAAREGTASGYWSEGDSIGIPIKGTFGESTVDGTYAAVILGFDHNAEIDDSKNTIDFQVGKNADGIDIAFVNNDYGNSSATATGFHMNAEASNAGGWKDCYLRTEVCPAFLQALPAEWQAVIVTAKKYTANTQDPTAKDSVGETPDSVWLLSEGEIFGTQKNANSWETDCQKQYAYYANGNSRARRQHDNTDKKCAWLTRSPNVKMKVDGRDGTNSFCCVSETGEADCAKANMLLGFAPCFRVG